VRLVPLFALALMAQTPVISSPSSAGPQPAVHETVRTLMRRGLPNAAGKDLIAVEVLFPPGALALPHTHPAFTYAYVVSGAVVSGIGNEQPRTYGPGESWTESPGAEHRITRNASKREAAKLLAVFIARHGQNELVRPLTRAKSRR
jgi:quercetin dioxygenase-like cupin family protein